MSAPQHITPAASVAAHTPGPWSVVRGYLISSNVDADECVLDRPTTNDGIYVAQAKGPDAEANARLMAAAPDLLAALEDLLSATREVGYVHYAPYRRAAEAAIAKALGK
jgi:hypothetical protein